MIRKARTISGRLIDSRTVELDEAVGAAGDRVEVMLTALQRSTPADAQGLIEFLRSLPPGRRTRAEIDAQIAEERASWGAD